MSIRRTSASAKVSYGTVYRKARSVLNLHPYKIKILHQLKPPDYEKRKAFANWFLSIEWLKKIIFSSQVAYFCLNGAVNNHN
jgi:hypothetical protein